jgi:hypothetical protein
MSNDHYIPRGQTKPWEFDDPFWGERRLCIFSLESGTFEWKSSKTHFARPELNPKHVERLLNKYVETPLEALRTRIQRTEHRIKDWNEGRAIVLALYLQALRTAAVIEQDQKSGEVLAQLVEQPEQVIDSIAVHLMKGSQPVVYRIAPPSQLYFPGYGMFVVPAYGPDGIHFVPCAPIDLRMFIAILPKSAAIDLLANAAAHGDYCSGLSVGLNAPSVVIPPCLLNRRPDEIANAVRRSRDFAREQIRLMQLMQPLSNAHYALAGRHPDVPALFRRKLEAAKQAAAVSL